MSFLCEGGYWVTTTWCNAHITQRPASQCAEAEAFPSKTPPPTHSFPETSRLLVARPRTHLRRRSAADGERQPMRCRSRSPGSRRAGLARSAGTGCVTAEHAAPLLGSTVILRLGHPRSLRGGRAISFTARMLNPATVRSPALAARAKHAVSPPPVRFARASLFIDDGTAPVIGECILQPYTQCEGADLQGADLHGAQLVATATEPVRPPTAAIHGTSWDVLGDISQLGTDS